MGNAGTVRVDIRYPRRSEFDSCAQTVQLQWNVLVHHPIAAGDCINVGPRRDFGSPYLVVEPAFAVKELEELRVSFSAPEVEITDFEIAPD